MESEYKRNFTWLLQGSLPLFEEHVRDYTHGILISLADEPMAIHLLVRIIVKAYAAGLEVWQQGGRAAPAPHAYPSRHVAEQCQHPAQRDSAQEQHRRSCALFKEACKNEEENINVLFNTLNDAMKELAEE